jgi:hypothetical protein
MSGIHFDDIYNIESLATAVGNSFRCKIFHLKNKSALIILPSSFFYEQPPNIVHFCLYAKGLYLCFKKQNNTPYVETRKLQTCGSYGTQKRVPLPSKFRKELELDQYNEVRLIKENIGLFKCMFTHKIIMPDKADLVEEKLNNAAEPEKMFSLEKEKNSTAMYSSEEDYLMKEREREAEAQEWLRERGFDDSNFKF